MAESSHDHRAGPSQRIDKLLWFIRVCKSRSLAQSLAVSGFVRLNGRRVERAHAPVRIGDLITIPHGNHARAFRILSLPVRRGPPAEAEACYEELRLGSEADDSHRPRSHTPPILSLDAKPVRE